MAKKKRFGGIYWRQFSLTAGMVLLTIGMLLFLALTYFLADTARKALQHLRCPPWANVLVMALICAAMFALLIATSFTSPAPAEAPATAQSLRQSSFVP